MWKQKCCTEKHSFSNGLTGWQRELHSFLSFFRQLPCVMLDIFTLIIVFFLSPPWPMPSLAAFTIPQTSSRDATNLIMSFAGSFWSRIINLLEFLIGRIPYRFIILWSNGDVASRKFILYNFSKSVYRVLH